VIGAVDGSARGGKILDLALRPRAVDGLGRVEAIVGERRVRYTSAKEGSDDTTGAAFLQVTGHPEGDASFEIVTRYDVAPGLTGVVFHTSFKIAGRSFGGAMDGENHGAAAGVRAPIGVGDAVSFPEDAALQITAGARDVAAFGPDASYALEPLGDG